MGEWQIVLLGAFQDSLYILKDEEGKRRPPVGEFHRPQADLHEDRGTDIFVGEPLAKWSKRADMAARSQSHHMMRSPFMSTSMTSPFSPPMWTPSFPSFARAGHTALFVS